MKKVDEVFFLSGQGNHEFGTKILVELSELFGQRCQFDHLAINKYSDGEFDNRIVNYEKIKGKTIIFYQSMSSQELVDEALDLIWACKHQYGASYIIGVFPFLWNRRQDPMMKEDEKERWSKKIVKKDEIQRLKKTIHLLSVCGINEMMVATPHSNAMKNACDEHGIKFHEIDPSALFATTVQTFVSSEEQSLIKIYAPDAGSIPRAVNLAKIIHCSVLFNLKNRAINNKTSIVKEEASEMERLVNEFRTYYNYDNIEYITPELVKQKIIIMIEDEVASGETANNTGQMLQKFNVKSIFLFATHPVLTFGWRNKLFYCDPFKKIIMTDTIKRGFDKRTGGKIFDISLAPLFGSSLFKILNKL